MQDAAAKPAEYQNPIVTGVIWKQLLMFFFPMLLGTFFQQLYNTVDAVIVGQFVGKQALAAVGGVTGTLINLLVNLFVGIASGTTVVVAQKYGAASAKPPAPNAAQRTSARRPPRAEPCSAARQFLTAF